MNLFCAEQVLIEGISMSPTDCLPGTEGLIVQRVERRRDIHVWAKPRDRLACVHCLQTAVRIKATYSVHSSTPARATS